MPRRSTAAVKTPGPPPLGRPLGQGTPMADELRLVNLAELEPNPWNPRRSVSVAAEAELQASIREVGVLEPLIVRRVTRGSSLDLRQVYQVVAGMRRYQAATAVGLVDVPCVVKTLDDRQALELALTENLQRADMNPIDEADAYERLHAAEPALYTNAAIARRIGQTESYVYRRRRLLTLEPWAVEALRADRLTVRHAELLLRLTPAQRTDALDQSVIWFHSPLLRGTSEDALPTRDDLAPVHQLEAFIRRRTRFDPATEETKHLQPDLQEQMVEALVEGDGLPDEMDAAVEAAKSELVELSEDPMCRVQIGAAKGDRIPLTPSKWREITARSGECDFTVRGVVVHGGPARVLQVCATKKCAKHFPPPKKAKATSRAAAPRQPTWEEQEQRRKAERAAWDQLLARALPAFAVHLQAQLDPPTPEAIVRTLLRPEQIREVEQEFGVALTAASAGVVAACSTIRTWERGVLLADVKPYKFNLGTVEKQLKAEQKKAAKAEAPAKASVLAGVEAVVWHACGGVGGGHDRVRQAVLAGWPNPKLDQLIRAELGTGGYAGDGFEYATKNGQLLIAKPMKRKLTVGKVRDIVRRLFVGPTSAKKGTKAEKATQPRLSSKRRRVRTPARATKGRATR